MVSLLKLAEITEEGVTFENPFELLCIEKPFHYFCNDLLSDVNVIVFKSKFSI